MNPVRFTPQELVQWARFNPGDWEKIQACRQPYTRLGFAYQLAFVRLTHQLPGQHPLEVVEELLTYVSVQLAVPASAIEDYARQRSTMAYHQQDIRGYLKLRFFGEAEMGQLGGFLFEEACRLEQTGPLLAGAKTFLRENGILFPSDDTLRRLIVTQRQAARDHIFTRLAESLPLDLKESLDAILQAGTTRMTHFYALKQPPGKPSPAAVARLAKKVEQIQATGVLAVDLSWLNNNYQRTLARYARRCSADRLRNLQAEHRYGVLVCFLWQLYRDSIDHLIDMHDKLMTAIYSRAQADIDEQTRQQRQMIQHSLATWHDVGGVLLDESVDDHQLRQVIFGKVDREELLSQMTTVATWLTGKYSHVFNLVMERFSYVRQFAPAVLQHLEFRLEEGAQSSIVEAVGLLRQLNQENKRTLPDEVPLEFIPKSLHSLVESEGQVSKRAWECALLTAIRDEIRAGNVYVSHSKRFGRFADFFISDSKWAAQRDSFFHRAGLPVEAEDVPAYLSQRLNEAYDHCLQLLPSNTYASVQDDSWHLSADPADKLDSADKQRLAALHTWLGENLRDIKLPELLIEVDNDLHFTHPFMTFLPQEQRTAEQVCLILATLMAHGCNVGPYTMARLTEGITYGQIKHVTDWQLTEEAQRQALAQVVNAISQLDVTQAWGAGKTSSSDGQRFRLKRKVLQQTYSPRFNDYAIEFYSFVADNYAPFYTTPIECTDRDAAYVLDGLLYKG